MRSPRKQRRGSQAIEFALITPVFLTLVAGIVSYGWYFANAWVLSVIVRDAARAGSVSADYDDSETKAEATLASLATDYGVTLNNNDATLSGDPPASDRIITVTAELEVEELFGLEGLVVPSTASYTFVMRTENQEEEP